MEQYNNDIDALLTQKRKELETRKQNISNLEQLQLDDETQKEALIEKEREALEAIEKELLSLEDQKEIAEKTQDEQPINQDNPSMNEIIQMDDNAKKNIISNYKEHGLSSFDVVKITETINDDEFKEEIINNADNYDLKKNEIARICRSINDDEFKKQFIINAKESGFLQEAGTETLLATICETINDDELKEDFVVNFDKEYGLYFNNGNQICKICESIKDVDFKNMILENPRKYGLYDEHISRILKSIQEEKEVQDEQPINQEYEKAQNRKKILIDRRDKQQRELESLSVENDSYRMQELSNSIDEISRQIDSLDRIMSELDEDLEMVGSRNSFKEEPIQEKSEDFIELESKIKEIEIKIEELENKYLDIVDQGLKAKEEIYDLAKELNANYLKQQERYETLIFNHGEEDAELIEDLTQILEKAKQRQKYYQITSESLEKEIDNDEVNKLNSEVEKARLNVEEAVNRFEDAEKETNKEEYEQARINLETAQQVLADKDNELNALKETKSNELEEIEREIEREKINIEEANSSFEAAKVLGDQDEYDFAEASLSQAKERLRVLEERHNKLQSIEEANNLSEETKKPKKLTPEEIMNLERETLDAETEIIELEEKIKEAQKNLDYFDAKAVEYSDEIIEKTNELINLINGNELEDKKELNRLERETAQKKLELAVAKKNKYQSIIDELEKEKAQKKEIVDRNNEILIGQREAVTDNNIDENELVEDTDNSTEEDQSDPSNEDNDGVATEENDQVDIDNPSNPVEEEEPAEIGEPEEEPSVPFEPVGEEPEVDEPRVSDEQDDEDIEDEEFSLLDDEEEIYPSELQEILLKIRTNPDTDEAVGVSVRERKRVDNANISLSRVWKDEIYADQTTYSVVSFAPTLFKMGFLGIKKIAAKIMGTAGAKKKLEMVRNNIQNLSDREKKVLFTEYMNNNMVSEIALQPINGVIRDEAINYIREQEIAPRVNKQGAIFTSIFETYNIVQDHNIKIAALENGDITVDDICNELGIKKIEGLTAEILIEQLEARKKVLVDGMDEKIKLFWKNNRQISKLYNGGGVHGIIEEERATSSKQNLDGRRGAKNRNSDEGYEESKEELRYRKGLEEAVRRGDNEEAMDLFVKIEQLRLSRVEHGVGAIKLGPIPILPTFGADKGTIHYMPIAGELDYRPDPFVRNLITTAAATVAIVNSVGRIMDRIEAAHANDHNLAVENRIHKAGDELAGQKDVFDKKVDNDVASTGEARRATTEYSDTADWRGQGGYTSHDLASHTNDNNAYFEVQRQIENVRNQVSNGQLSSADGMQQIAELSTQYHNDFLDILQKSLPDIKRYAEATNYDYSSFIDSIEKMVNNPSTIDSEYQALIDSIQTGVELQNESIMALDEGLLMPILGTGACIALTGLALGKYKEGPIDEPKDLSEIVANSIERDNERKNQFDRFYVFEEDEYQEDYDENYEEEFENEEEILRERINVASTVL